MDVLELVREINTNDVPVSEEQINIARQALLLRIVRDERAVSRSRRRWTGASVAIGGVAIAVIAVSVLAPTRVDPAAAAVLEGAADVTINAVDTQLAPGQYLRIQTDDATLWKWDADIGDPESRFNNAYRGDAEAGLLVSETRVLYVPADRSGDWIWDWSGDERVIETFGTRSAEAVDDWTEVITSSDSGYWPDIQRLPGGETLAADGDNHEYLLDSNRRSYDEMPRDPQQLLDWFRARSGDPAVADEWVVGAITDVLSANLMPADLRAATLRALALVPGIQVQSTEGASTTLVYRSHDWGWSRTTTIVVDTAEGMITSVAQTFSGADHGVLPETVPDSTTTVTTTVVDRAPQP